MKKHITGIITLALTLVAFPDLLNAQSLGCGTVAVQEETVCQCPEGSEQYREKYFDCDTGFPLAANTDLGNSNQQAEILGSQVLVDRSREAGTCNLYGDGCLWPYPDEQDDWTDEGCYDLIVWETVPCP